jgi:hypothetical protein
MATNVFDRETLLDLTVNFVPLFILAFFIVGYVVWDPFGIDSTSRILQYVLLVAPFVLLAVLTYLSGKAIATTEREAPVYLPGAATVDGAEPIETPHGHEESAADDSEAGDDADAEPEPDDDA